VDYLVFDTRARASFLKYKFALAYSRLSSSSSSRRTANTRSNEFKRCNSSASDAIQASRGVSSARRFRENGRERACRKRKKDIRRVFFQESTPNAFRVPVKKSAKTRWVFARAQKNATHKRRETKGASKEILCKRCPRRYRLSSSRIRRFLIARRGEEGEEMERKFFRVLRLLVLR